MPEAINYTNGLSNAWSNVATFIPKLVVFLIILAVGLIAALDQLHVATNVVSAVLYATLAAVAGVVIVAVGGGGIKTMSQRWDAAASKYDQEKPRIAEAARNAPSVKDQARQAKDTLSSRSGGAGSQADGVAGANGATRY